MGRGGEWDTRSMTGGDLGLQLQQAGRVWREDPEHQGDSG